MYREKKSSDLTQGKLGTMIIKFAIPLAIMGMVQQLFNAVDVAVVGRFVGKEAMAAVGSNSSIVGLLINLFVGLAAGVNVVCAQSTGEKDYNKIGKEVHTSFILAVVGGLILIVFGELIAKPVLIWTSVPEEIFDLALLYIRIYILGLPIIFIYNFEASIFRSQGDTKTPMISLICAGILNVLLNLFLVIVLKWSVMGVAIATVFSNFVSSFIMFILLLKTDGPCKVKWSCMKVDKESLKNIVSIGLPAGFQMTLFSLAGIIVQSAVNQLGPDIMAATSSSFYIEVTLHYIITAFGSTVMTFVGQNYGAKKFNRCRKSLTISLAQCMAIVAVLVATAYIFGAEILSLFTTDAKVIELGVYRLSISLPAVFFHVVTECLTGALRGIGKSSVPAIMSFIGSCVIRVIWIYTAFAIKKTFFVLLIIHPITWAFTSLATVIYYFYEMNKLKEVTE